MSFSKKRLDWIDLCKGIGMFFVIFSHLDPPYLSCRFFTPFFLPIFFFVSGYTWSPKDNFISYFIHKCKSLLAPFLCLGTINMIAAMVADGDSLYTRVSGLFFQRHGMGDDLWFIACLFIVQMIMYIINYFCRKFNNSDKKYYIYMFISSMFLSLLGRFYTVLTNNRYPLVWQLENACMLNIFVVQGYFYKYLYKNLDLLKKLERSIQLTLVVFVLFIASVLVVNDPVNIHMAKYKYYLPFLISAFIGNYLIVLISKKAEYLKNNRAHNSAVYNTVYLLVVWVGQNTLVYYAFQSKAIRLTDLIYRYINFTVSNQYLRVFITTALIYLILIIPAWIIGRYFPFILGKKVQKTKR